MHASVLLKYQLIKYTCAFLFITYAFFREQPLSPEQKALDQQKVPLLLNFSQCQLLLGEYYQVLEHTSEVLKISPGMDWLFSVVSAPFRLFIPSLLLSYQCLALEESRGN